jgi:hypothetical protein
MLPRVSDSDIRDEDELILHPSAAALINSLRAIGYSFNAALADIVDNSIAAGADEVSINVALVPYPYVSIVDNGCGMDRDTLISAMRLGGVGPEAGRGRDDLGRYGLGLKTATLSQCRRLTVVTKRDGELSAAEWDLDQIARANEWILNRPKASTLADLPAVSELTHLQNGTLVLWTKFDRAVAGERQVGQALERLVDQSRDHLSLVFHRFLSGTNRVRHVSIRINGVALQPTDPFLTSNARTETLPEENIKIEGQAVRIQAFILPHLADIKNSELKPLGGREGLRLSQGFYVYRNNRLITAGTWFGMLHHDELSKLARVSVDIPNSLDHLWDLDVKKSRANPPEEVRQALKRIIQRIADRSQNVFRDRRRRAPAGPVTRLWERQNSRNGLSYAINPQHPFVSEVSDALPSSSRCLLDRLLRMIEVGLPLDSIYHDMSSDRSVEKSAPEVNESLRSQLESLLERVSNDPVAKLKLLSAIPRLEPFSMYPVITKKLLSEIDNVE